MQQSFCFGFCWTSPRRGASLTQVIVILFPLILGIFLFQRHKNYKFSLRVAKFVAISFL